MNPVEILKRELAKEQEHLTTVKNEEADAIKAGDRAQRRIEHQAHVIEDLRRSIETLEKAQRGQAVSEA